jgi:anti-anti-sigma regulatory factor
MDVTKDVAGSRMLQLDITQVSVDLAGEFDAYDLKPLCEILDGLSGSRGTACVDLSGVTFLDLRCARELAIRSDLCGGRLVLRNPSWEAVSSLRACSYGLLRESATRIAHNDAEFQLRVAFFGLLEPKERVKILDSRREFLEGLLDHLRAVGPEAEDIVEFQRSAVEHELAWISGLAEEVRRD